MTFTPCRNDNYFHVFADLLLLWVVMDGFDGFTADDNYYQLAISYLSRL